MSMFYSKVPITLDDLDLSFTAFNQTWKYLFDQAKSNIDYVFQEEQETLSELLEFLREWYASQNQRKIIYAAAGRSLFMGAKIQKR